MKPSPWTEEDQKLPPPTVTRNRSKSKRPSISSLEITMDLNEITKDQRDEMMSYLIKSTKATTSTHRSHAKRGFLLFLIRIIAWFKNDMTASLCVISLSVSLITAVIGLHKSVWKAMEVEEGLVGDWMEEEHDDFTGFGVWNEGRMFGLDDVVIEGLCRDGTNTSCRCQNPLIGSERGESWVQSHLAQNLNDISSIKNKTLDVVFLGDSITEEWSGRFTPRGISATDAKATFQQYFDKDKGYWNGLALGIAGDTCPNLLWRIQNGEMPEDLNPKIWWVLIGTNDLGRGCSEEVVLIGIQRVIEEIHIKKPNATIVINGILPRSSNRKNGRLDPNPGENNHWPMIQRINERISYMSSKRHNLYYFNATDLFIFKKEGEWYVDKKLVGDYLHPSVEGLRLWGEAIDDWLHDYNRGNS